MPNQNNELRNLEALKLVGIQEWRELERNGIRSAMCSWDEGDPGTNGYTTPTEIWPAAPGNGKRERVKSRGPRTEPWDPVKQGSVWFWNHLRYDYHVSLLRQNVIKTKLALAISPATQKKSLKKNIVAIESCWSIIIRQKGASSRARWRPQCIGVGGSHHAVGLEDYSKFRWSYYAPLVCYC